MKNLSLFNKFFLLLCAALIVMLALTVPHEKSSGEPVRLTRNAGK